jgi:hypothetical protein
LPLQHTHTHIDDIVDALEEQITCSATTGTEWYGNIPLPLFVQALTQDTHTHTRFQHCSGLSYRLNYGSLVLEIMDVSCYGIIIFVTMCSGVRSCGAPPGSLPLGSAT